MERNVLCKKDDILPGDKKIFQVRKLLVVVIRKEDQFFAIHNTCPHQAAPLGKGTLAGAAKPSDVREYCYEKRGEVLYCPWHHWSFDITTGCSLHNPENTKVKTYEVKVEADDVVLYA